MLFVVPGSVFWSWTILQRKMKDVIICGLFIILLDVLLCSARWAWLLLLECSSCGGLAGLWLFGLMKGVFLHVCASALTDGKLRTVLCRFSALLCLLPPVFETGWTLKAPPSEPYSGPSPNLSLLFLGAASSSLACGIWENLLSGDKNMKNDTVDTKRILMRVLTYFKPDSLYLIAAFSFLILGVFCKLETLMCSTLSDIWYQLLFYNK